VDVSYQKCNVGIAANVRQLIDVNVNILFFGWNRYRRHF